MVEKFRYGTKEIIVTLLGAGLAVLTYYAESLIFAPGSGPYGLFGYIHLRLLVVTLSGVFFGPVAGLLAGLGGELLVNVIFLPTINYPNILALGIYGFFIGLYFGKYHFDPDDLSGSTFVDLAGVMLMAGIFCEMLLLPLLGFLFFDRSLFDAVTDGAMIVIVNSVINMLICMPVIGLVHAIRRVPKRART